MAFSYIDYVLIYQTITSLAYVFVPLDLSPHYLLSPAHPEYAAIVSQAVPVDFRFDERLK